MSARVIAVTLRQLADLHAWGREYPADPAVRPSWWALVSWAVYGNLDGGGNGHVHCSAWVPAEHLLPSVDPSQGTLYRQVERFDLPPERNCWPTPAASRGRQWHHYGTVLTRPPAPPGVTGLSGVPPPHAG